MKKCNVNTVSQNNLTHVPVVCTCSSSSAGHLQDVCRLQRNRLPASKAWYCRKTTTLDGCSWIVGLGVGISRGQGPGQSLSEVVFWHVQADLRLVLWCKINHHHHQRQHYLQHHHRHHHHHRNRHIEQAQQKRYYDIDYSTVLFAARGILQHRLQHSTHTHTHTQLYSTVHT